MERLTADLPKMAIERETGGAKSFQPYKMNIYIYIYTFLDVADRGILIAKCVVTYDRDDGFHNNLTLVAYVPAQNHFKPYELHFGTLCDYPGSRSALFFWQH